MKYFLSKSNGLIVLKAHNRAYMRRRFAPWPSAHFALAFARQNVIYARNVTCKRKKDTITYIQIRSEKIDYNNYDNIFIDAIRVWTKKAV